MLRLTRSIRSVSISHSQLLHDLSESSLLGADDRCGPSLCAADRARRIVDLGITVDVRRVGVIGVPGEDRAGNLVAVAGRLDVVTHNDDPVELEAALHSHVAL